MAVWWQNQIYAHACCQNRAFSAGLPRHQLQVKEQWDSQRCKEMQGFKNVHRWTGKGNREQFSLVHLFHSTAEGAPLGAEVTRRIALKLPQSRRKLSCM
ncbi:Hypothetical predicted protein [Podarcis lilfordi]|uniref:Uncharacterized protein n=1 Tax=Podarcis lilfordi TaxID=74358 RepID=A0AA35PLC3_9SAUR|nr:Hypothetical predicted protein [Podarcis lilfordi]